MQKQHLQQQNQHIKQQQQAQQHQAQAQDSRRTLIKNQLYLIEQLQLENANLRNERDLLQLENEELKFQLQMISSSQILGQPARGGGDHDDAASTFGHRQLANITETTTTTNDDEVAAESGETTTTTTTKQATDENAAASLATGENNNLSQGYRWPAKGRQANHVTRPVISQHQKSTSTSSTTNKTTATQAKALQAATIDNERSNANNSGGSDQLQLLTKITATPVRQPLRLMNCDDLTFSNRDTRSAGVTVTGASAAAASTTAQTPRVASLTNGLARPNDNDQLLAQLATDDDEQDGDARARLVQQLYGDWNKAQAAAVVIQRAFRKQQICKRFRMITDQLRSHTQRQHQQPATTEQQQQQQLGRQKSMDAAVPYASGATRAAAWESLSQAASRLAQSAAAARQQANGEKQTATCQQKQLVDTTTTKSLSNGQQTIETTSSSSTLASDSSGSSGHGTTATTTTTSSTTGSVHEQQQQQVVAAAALNFQQLESIRKRQYRVGLNIFNKSPEKGISFLIAHSFIDCSPPYTKSSSQTTTTTTSYYLSNQLHFIDKQHCLTAGAARQARSPPTLGDNQQTTTAAAIMDAASRESCRFCFEEENLKMNVAHFLLHRKGLAKEKIGQYLGNLQCKFNQDVLVYYLQELDFYGLQVDVALRKFSTSVRMPGEAQKIERFVDRFAARYVECQQQHASPVLRPNSATDDFMTSIAQQATTVVNPQPILLTSSGVAGGRVEPTDRTESNNTSGNTRDANAKNNLTLLLLTKDEIFILTFAIIMLNTDLHSPSLKSTARMSSHQFINNLRGVFKSQTINESDLIEIYERVKAKQITTTPDHVTHVMKVQQGLTTQNFREKKELPNLCVAHRRLVCFCRLFEVYDVNKKERPGQHQREIFLFNDMLLVTKLARGRTRANTPQQYTYRQCIMLRGLYVQLFRSAHYCFGIRLCQQSNDATLIMFNARNELDQSRFVDDLNESIAEMDEMETIRAHNIVETIHFKQQDRLRRHQMMHDPSQGLDGANSTGEQKKSTSPRRQNTGKQAAPSSELAAAETDESFSTNKSNVTVIQVAKSRRMSASKFSSMSNLASLAESDECENNRAETDPNENITRAKDGPGPGCALRPNRSFADSKIPEQQSDSHKSSPQRLGNHLMSTVTNGLAGRILRSCSTNSVHSLDSGLFLSRDVSPNQSG